MKARSGKWPLYNASILFEPALEMWHNGSFQTHHRVNHLGLDFRPGFAVQLMEAWAGNRPGNGMIGKGLLRATRIPQPEQCPTKSFVDLLASTDKAVVDLFTFAG